MAAPYRVELTKSAQKEYGCLPAAVQKRVVEALKILAQSPFTELLKIKKLKGADSLYRIRFGDYRLVYEIRQNVLILLVIKIGHRKEVYRSL